MPAQILDGNKIANERLSLLKAKIETFHKTNQILPKLVVILLGDDPASKIYVQNKLQACKDVDMSCQDILLTNNTTQEQLLKIIDEHNNKEDVHGILVQLPLPKHIDQNIILSAINPLKDVDGLHPINMGKLLQNTPTFIPCTPLGIINLLEHYKLHNFTEKNVTIIGSSLIVGKPLAMLLTNLGATVTLCNILTKDLSKHLTNADLIVSAIGKRNIVQTKWFKPGIILIDVGINRHDDGTISGDLDFESAKKVASYITPVPGGVGPMTVTSLLENTYLAATNKAASK